MLGIPTRRAVVQSLGPQDLRKKHKFRGAGWQPALARRGRLKTCPTKLQHIQRVHIDGEFHARRHAHRGHNRTQQLMQARGTGGLKLEMEAMITLETKDRRLGWSE